MARYFYACLGIQICTTFTSSVRSVYEVHEVHHPLERITIPDGGIWNNHLICFTPLHSNVSNWVRAISTSIKYCIKEDIPLNVFDTTRIPLETQTFTSSVRSIYEFHLEHMKRLRGSRVSISIWNI